MSAKFVITSGNPLASAHGPGGCAPSWAWVYDGRRMSRYAKLLLLPAALLVALLTAACGTQRIDVPKDSAQAADGNLYHGAVLFSQRCAGCHTLSYAGTHGSAPNIRSSQGNSGPNFDQRCERPIDRVLYAIENGGFSGAYMPQNIVVGHDAVDVAEFVSKYAGHQAATSPGQPTCQQKAIGSLPADTEGVTSTSTSAVSTKPAVKRPQLVSTHATHAKKHAA
jgi:mono/diheme cytochrome c family protein